MAEEGLSSSVRPLLDRLEAVAREKNPGMEKLVEALMQVRSIADLFGNPLVGALSRLMIGFLDAAGRVDENVLTIILAHNSAVLAVTEAGVTDEKSEAGIELQQELRDACKRYFAKQARDG